MKFIFGIALIFSVLFTNAIFSYTLNLDFEDGLTLEQRVNDIPLWQPWTTSQQLSSNISSINGPSAIGNSSLQVVAQNEGGYFLDLVNLNLAFDSWSFSMDINSSNGGFGVLIDGKYAQSTLATPSSQWVHIEAIKLPDEENYRIYVGGQELSASPRPFVVDTLASSRANSLQDALLFGVANNGQTIIGNFDNINFSTPIPEPSSLLMLAFGSILVTNRRRNLQKLA